MSISELIIQNEKTFKGAVDLKYFFWPASKPCNYLVVGFSGFNGKEAEGEPARYNYVKQLRNFDCHRLFILDSYDGHPCYYLGRETSLDYDATVAALIHSIANRLNVPSLHIITCGTSKGGTAALYFGVKYSLGHVVAGGMQIKVGDYLYSLGRYPRDTVLKFITGRSDEAGRDYLNSFYETSLFENPIHTDLNLHGGSGDYHYLEHVLPFTERLKQQHVPFRLDVQDYSDHGLIGNYFTGFLIDQLARITRILTVKSVSIEWNGEHTLRVFCKLPAILKDDKQVQCAFYILRDKQSEPVKKFTYSAAHVAEYTVQEPGLYRARVYVRKNGEIISVGTGSIRVSQ